MKWKKENSFYQNSILTLLDEETSLSIEVSVHTPTKFQLENWHKILPDWQLPPSAVVIVLQQTNLDLTEKLNLVEAEKKRLRENFLLFSYQIVDQAAKLGIKVEPIDPSSGKSLFGTKGELIHDDGVAISLLLKNINIFQIGNCKILEHPRWKRRNYPSILFSSAFPEKIQSVIEDL